MIQTANLGESSAQQPSVLLGAPMSRLAHDSGLLGNQRAQTPVATAEFGDYELWLWTMLGKEFGAARSDSKLAIVKRQKFTPEGRAQRIAASIAALEARQPTVLTREQWKEIVEEAEDDDDED